MGNYAQFCAGEITREAFIDKLKYYCAKDRWYANHGFYGDAISKDFRIDGLSLLVPPDMPDSMEKVFQSEGILTHQGFSTALYHFAKMYGVDYNDDAMYREYAEKNRFDDQLSRITGASFLRQDQFTQGAGTAGGGTRTGNVSIRQDTMGESSQSGIGDKVKTDVVATTLDTARHLLKGNNIDLKKMPNDYVAFQGSIPILKILGGSLIVDKFGNVYVAGSLSASGYVGIPVKMAMGVVPNNKAENGTYTKKRILEEKYREAIEGWSLTGSVTGGVGGTIGVSSAGPVLEIQAGVMVEGGITLSHTWWIGNIGDN